MKVNGKVKSKSFAPDSSGQKNVAVHHSHSLGMGAAQVGVFKEGDNRSFRGFLEGLKS